MRVLIRTKNPESARVLEDVKGCVAHFQHFLCIEYQDGRVENIDMRGVQYGIHIGSFSEFTLSSSLAYH